MVHTVRHWISFGVGLLIALIGLFSIIGKKAWLGPLDGIIGAILAYILAFGGLYMIFDSFFEFTFHGGIFMTTLIVGVVVFGIGIINVLFSFGKIGFHLPIPEWLYLGLFIIEGIFLMIATFVMD